MSAPSEHCGRLGNHDPHPWTGRVWPHTFYMCPGHVTTEGGQPCAECARPVAACRCEIERAEARDAEWWA